MAIACLADYGITRGDGTGAYGVGSPVTRRQMVTFLYRTGTYLGIRWDTSPAGFADAGLVSGEQLDAVNALANANIARGREVAGQRVFEPGGVVSRGQMAAFLNRFDAELDSAVNGFADFYTDEDGVVDDEAEVTFSDDEGVFRADIRAVATAGIARGVGDGSSYRPNQPVTRSQMARFLARLLEFGQMYRGSVDGLPRSPYRADNESGEVAPRTDRTVGLRETAEWTFSGLTGSDYRLALLPPFLVDRFDGGYQFFADSPDGTVDTDEFPVAARLTAVDGGPLPADGVLQPVDGRLTVTVTTGDVDEVVVPVLHRGGPTAGIDIPEDEPDLGAPPEDADDPDADLRYGPPLDEIAVGGPLAAAAPLAADGTTTSGVPGGGRSASDVIALRQADGTQVRLTYDRGDRFTLDGRSVTLERFEQELTYSFSSAFYHRSAAPDEPAAATLSVTAYSADRAGRSTFALVVPPDGTDPRKALLERP